MQSLDPGVTVDVRIPTYGRQPYLAEAVESVLAQRFASWQLVIQENGPGDEWVADVVSPYLQDPRVRYLATGKTVTQEENFTRAIQGDGRYVGMLHDDDRWEPGFLERRVTFLEAHPSCGFVFSAHREIDGKGEEIRRRTFFHASSGLYQPTEFVPRLYQNSLVLPPTILVRRAAYEAVGSAFSDRFAFMSDYEMSLRLALRFPVGYLDVHDCAWRVHASSLTGQRPHLGEAYLAFIDHAEGLIERELPAVRLAPDLRRRKRSYAHIKAALDAAEEGKRRRGLSHLVSGLRVHPRSLLDPRVPVALGALALGRRAVGALARLRSFVFRHELNVHARGKAL